MRNIHNHDLEQSFGSICTDTNHIQRSLEALPVHNGGTMLTILLLGDPHLLEGGH